MTKTSTLSTRIDPELKKSAEAVLGSLGLRPSDAINMLMAQIVLQQGLPFAVKLPNAKTRTALDEARTGKNLSKKRSAKNWLDDLR